MKYQVGDSVTLNADKSYSDGTRVPAGTSGRIETAYPLSISYRVKLTGFPDARRVLEKDLDRR